MRLIEKTVKGLKAPLKGNVVAWDSEVPGFGLRLTAGGAKSFILNYRNRDGTQRRLTIGRFPSLSATAARQQARELKAKVELGGDPLAAQGEHRRALTFRGLVDLFAERHLANMKQGQETERYLRRYAIPSFGKLKAAGVKRQEIIHLVEKKATTAPVAANRLLSSIRRMYNWGIRRGLIESNPCALTQPPTVEKSRDRVLSDDEIREFWMNVDSASRMSDGVRTALRLLLVLGQRPSEICGMEWTELDAKRGWWEIPGERTKSERVHRIPITALAAELIGKQPKTNAWVFSSSLKSRPLQVHALSHALRHNREHFGLQRFTPHDLRRTCASHLAAVGVERFLIGRVLNHADREITGIYDRYSYDKEKRRALEKWERKLRSIIGTPPAAKVVSIR